MKALFFSPYADVWVFSLPAAEIADALRDDGWEIHRITCNRDFSKHCVSMAAKGIDFVDIYLHSVKGSSMSDLDERHNSSKENSDPLLSMKEAANYLNVRTSTMYDIAKREQFPVTFITTDRKIKKSVLDAYINSKQTTWRWN